MASTLTPSIDRRARIKAVLEKRGLLRGGLAEETSESWLQERFVARAKSLFYARMMFLTLGLCILAVPVWRRYFDFSPLAFGWYFFMLLYSVANYLMLEHPRVGKIVTYLTLCLDLVVMVIVVVKPQTGGGLQNPLLATQLLFTTLFALLYPKPLAIMPPLLALPLTARIDQLLDRSPTAIEVLTLFWYLALNFIVIYVLVYLNEREVSAHREVITLQADLKELAILEERNRLAREIHDGLGANLSSLIIQAEYVARIATEQNVRDEVGELKSTAEEAIDELRRSLSMMREDFDLAQGLEEYAKTFARRAALELDFHREGRIFSRLPPEPSLALFRVLQECLANAAKHAKASRVDVRLNLSSTSIQLLVRDDGSGFDVTVPTPGHYGLLNMRERAAKLAGSVTVDSEKNRGTTVVFTVPIEASA
jgi:signal transduction histidine kinase